MEINDYGVIADWYDVYVPATFDIPFFVSEARQCACSVNTIWQMARARC